ncbi:MFS general substrate transporter [Tricholoma matsutake]|nr:MFS general substrate transporter [Tricholoma matsutake 945]
MSESRPGSASTARTWTVLDEVKRVEDSGSETQPEPPPEYPEGGWQAWCVVVGVWLTQFCTLGYNNSYGVYNDFYVREYLNNHYVSSEISWIGSAQLFLAMSTGFFAGRAFDAGYFYSLMIGGSILYVFCLFMLSLSHPQQYYQVFLTQGLGTGFGIGITYMPTMALLTQYFVRRRALAIGIAVSGTALGGAIHPIMLNRLFHGPVGFHNGVRASAGLILGLLAVATVLMKPRLPPNRTQGNPFQDFRAFLSDPPYVVTLVGSFIVMAGFYFPIFFLQLNAIKNGLPSGIALYTLTILNGASIFGRVIPPLLVPRIGIINMTIIWGAVCGILIFSTLAIHDVAGTTVFAILYGFFSGAYAGSSTAMIGSLAANNSEIGTRMGICFAFNGLGGLIGTPIAGALLTSEFIWWRPILYSGLCVACGTLILTWTAVLVSRKKGTVWV